MKALTKILFALLLIAGVTNAFAETQDRHLSGFKAVNLEGSFDVYITQGSTESVTVEAPADQMENVKTTVENGTLRIYNKHNSNWHFNMFGNNQKKMLVYVTAKDLNAVTVSGSGDLTFKNPFTTSSLKLGVSGSGDMRGQVEVKTLQMSVSGSGDARITGHATTSEVRVSGSGDYSGSKMLTASTSVHVSGSGNASIYATEKVDASVSGSGDISYSGGAKSVSSSKSGSGDIHKGW